MATDATALDPATASPVELLLLADEAEEAGATWEEVAWLRLVAKWIWHIWYEGESPAQYGRVSVENPDLLDAIWATTAGGVTWKWHRIAHRGRHWRNHTGRKWSRVEPPPQVRRLVEAAAEVAVRRVLAAEGVTGAAPGA